MAKWGEGDPRWIVEDRPDATNVNNWHWSEKNAGSWSKDKLKALLEGMVLKKDGLGEVRLTVSKCEGEATANNRKGKLIFFYEWVLTIDWVATLDDPDAAEAKGTLDIPNLSEENEPHEVDVNVTITAGGSSAEDVKTFLRKDGTKQVQDKLAEYVVALKEEFAQNLILPTTKGGKVAGKARTIIASNTSTIKPVNSVSSATASMGNIVLGGPCKLDVKDLSLRHSFKCRVDELYNVFTIPELVAAFTRNSVKIEAVKGGKFEMFGGNINGIFENLESNKLIVQRWRFKTWPDGHYSTVTLNMSQAEDCTELELLQTSIPSSDFDRTRDGWHNYYWESIKRTFGFGATLM